MNSSIREIGKKKKRKKKRNDASCPATITTDYLIAFLIQENIKLYSHKVNLYEYSNAKAPTSFVHDLIYQYHIPICS
jgi:hypothetical protein